MFVLFFFLSQIPMFFVVVVTTFSCKNVSEATTMKTMKFLFVCVCELVFQYSITVAFPIG